MIISNIKEIKNCICLFLDCFHIVHIPYIKLCKIKYNSFNIKYHKLYKSIDNIFVMLHKEKIVIFYLIFLDSLILTYLKNQLSIENTSIEKLTILLYHYK